MTENPFDAINREAAQVRRKPRQRPLDGTEGDYAKANKERTRAVCGFRRSERVVECNGTVGTILRRDRSVARSARMVVLSEAFVQDHDAIWRYSKYAAARPSLGLAPRSRHGARLSFARLSHEVRSFPRSPAVVECPECGQLRVLDNDRLGVRTPAI